MSNLEALSEWCEKYYAQTNIRVHPQNIPVEVLLNEIMIGMKCLGNLIQNCMQENARTAKDLLEVTHLINQLLDQKEVKKTKKEVKK